MRKDYQNQEIDTSQPAVPDTVSVALAELAGEMREGLLALAVGTGLQVMAAIMEADVTAACGPKGRHDPERTATRHGHGAGSVSLGGRRVPVQRPRMRAVDGSGEVAVAAYELFSDTEVLGRMALDRMLAGLSTRHYGVGLEPVGARTETAATATSRSAVSRRFVAQTQTALAELLAADLSAPGPGGVHGRRGALRRAHLRGRPRDRHRRRQAPVGAGRGLDRERHPGHRTDRRAARARAGRHPPDPGGARRVQGAAPRGARCVRPAGDRPLPTPQDQKRQDHLPEKLRTTVASRMRRAYHADSALAAEAELCALAAELDRTHPGAAASLREGMAETLTVLRLAIPPTLARTFRSTNAVESMISICRTHASNVKNWRDGQMALRWCAAGMVEAGKQFRRVNGHMHLRSLRDTLEGHPTCRCHRSY